MNLLLYNVTCYKYNINKLKICKFNFSKPKSIILYINHNETI